LWRRIGSSAFIAEIPIFSGLTRAAGRAHFRGMSEERVTLEFIGKQLERVIDEQNSARDDLRVLTTSVLRLEGTLNGVLDQLHAMVSQHQRFDARLRRLEEERTP
jgi:septal ring factor EnvC (AmiA/AmiB activator)